MNQNLWSWYIFWWKQDEVTQRQLTFLWHSSLIWITQCLTYTLLILLSGIQDETFAAKSCTICYMMTITFNVLYWILIFINSAKKIYWQRKNTNDKSTAKLYDDLYQKLNHLHISLNKSTMNQNVFYRACKISFEISPISKLAAGTNSWTAWVDF